MNIKELVKKAVGINIGSFRESVNKANTNILNKKVYIKPEIDLSPVDMVFNERLNALEEGGSKSSIIEPIEDNVYKISDSILTDKDIILVFVDGIFYTDFNLNFPEEGYIQLNNTEEGQIIKVIKL